MVRGKGVVDVVASGGNGSRMLLLLLPPCFRLFLGLHPPYLLPPSTPTRKSQPRPRTEATPTVRNSTTPSPPTHLQIADIEAGIVEKKARVSEGARRLEEFRVQGLKLRC
jgi:hypothetical protein